MIDRYLSPSELKRLVSALLVVVLFIGLLSVLAFLVLPGLRNANAPDPSQGSAAAGGGTGWLDPTDYPAEKGRTLPPIDPATVMTPNPELLSRGQALFAQDCVSCHGPKGEGNGPAGLALNPRPRNFTQQSGWQNGYRIDAIYKTLEEGIKGSAMNAFTYLSKKDRMALVHYVRSLGSFDHGPDDPKAMQQLANLFASSGEVIPNRIPVSLAMVRLEGEFKAPAALDPARAPILGEAIANPRRAAETLSLVPGWRGSDKALAEGILLGTPGNGFRPGIALYTPAQWQDLRSALDREMKEAAR